MIQQMIQGKLDQIEKEQQVSILYACESGSRAWGFESQDSDYDVRFIYVRPRDWYLSVDLESRRDVIELPVDEVFDINGWDLRKSLQHMRKSNPALMEWLSASIIYRQNDAFVNDIKRLMSMYYSPKACFYHYLHMAKKNYRVYLRSEQVRIKKYFYVLRPLLAMKWLEQALGVVPIQFQVMVDQLIPEGALKQDIGELIVQKKSGFEAKYADPIERIDQFIVEEIERLSQKAHMLHEPSVDDKPLNRLFRDYV